MNKKIIAILQSILRYPKIIAQILIQNDLFYLLEQKKNILTIIF